MAFPLKLIFIYLCIILLLPIMFFSHEKTDPSKCPDSDQDRRSNHTMNGAGSKLYLMDKESGPLRSVALNLLRNLSYSEQKNIRVLSTIDQVIPLWNVREDNKKIMEASFSVTIVYQPLPNQRTSGLVFLILPGEALEFLQEYGAKDLAMQDDGTINVQATSRKATISGSSVSVAIRALEPNSSQSGINDLVRAIDVNIDAAAAFTYAVWIDYDRVGRRLSVSVDLEANPKPDNTIAEVNLNISRFTHDYVNFGLFSTVVQQFSVCRWNVTVEDLPYCPDKFHLLMDKRKIMRMLGFIIFFSSWTVLAVLLTVCHRYLDSRMQWELEQVAKSFERWLPGVPMRVQFADIEKATGNFHETMRLGGGGFGSVYRCTLPASASKTKRPMEVAVKRFTRDVLTRRYADFIAEVRIINRLRHKNIVPLVGWSFNKEPILVFEFMKNGSLDEHLFPKAGHGTGTGGPTGAAIRQWIIRYGIVRDVATGLHYVHHEYEPMVLHRDIKASNVMLDSSFSARLGDFGLACTVAVDQNSATGVAGTWGYIAPEYAMSGKATRQTDIYALGVLILEVVTGQKALIHHAVDDDDVHITDRVWRLHRHQRLPECLDAVVVSSSSDDDEQRQLDVASDAERLLLLGLACSSPNPSERPTMPEVMQVIGKWAPPPTVPLMKPRFVWPPEGVAWSDDNSSGSRMTSASDLYMSTRSTREPQVIFGQPTVVSETRAVGRHASLQLEQSVYVTATSELV